MKQEDKIIDKKKYKYYEIKVSIRDTHPLVWRRLKIPEKITFHELNSIIQLAFDWCGYHGYSFEIGATLHQEGLIVQLEEEWCSPKVKSSKKERIDKYFQKYKKMKYTYDFGDDWIHDITIEKIVETDIKLNTPICIKAKMANLPEDCGGTWGYEELLEILSNKENEGYSEMRDWVDSVDTNWCEDRNYVDIEKINMNLEDYKGNAELLLEDIY